MLLVKKNDTIRLTYSNGSRPEYVGRVEKIDDRHVVVELTGETNAKGKPLFRTFHRDQIVLMEHA